MAWSRSLIRVSFSATLACISSIVLVSFPSALRLSLVAALAMLIIASKGLGFSWCSAGWQYIPDRKLADPKPDCWAVCCCRRNWSCASIMCALKLSKVLSPTGLAFHLFMSSKKRLVLYTRVYAVFRICTSVKG